MQRQVIWAVLGVSVAWVGAEAAFGQERAVARQPIRTIPEAGKLRRSPPAPVSRPAAWVDVEQRFEVTRRERKEWNKPYSLLEVLYARVADPDWTSSKSMDEHLAHLEKWRIEMPKSPTARVVAARALIRHAWDARGSGWASTVTGEGWKLFGERIAKAHALLDEAIELGVKDGEAYSRLMVMSYAEGQPREKVDEWLAAGMKLDPTYYQMYDEMAVYLMPRWGGEPGDIEQFAGEVARKLGGENGLEAYARIAMSIQHYECGWGETLFRGEYDPAMLVQGAEVVLKRFPYSPNAAHFAALCSMVAQDHAAAKRIRPFVGEYKESEKIWPWETPLTQFRHWSGAAESPGGEESKVFAGIMGCKGIAFGNQRRHVWVSQQYGSSAANLMDVRTGEVELALPSPGRSINEFLYDAGREWAVFATSGDSLVGWMLWDLSGARPPVMHETGATCGSLALDPRRPIVYWSEGQKVKSWNIETDAAGVEIETTEHVRELRLSADGKLLAANDWIYDTTDGTIKHRFGRPMQPSKLNFRVQAVLAIDEEGRPWATVVTGGGKEAKISLRRFSADGTTWETLLEDVGSYRTWLSPDRKLLATTPLVRSGAAVSRIDIWNIASQKRVKQFDGHWNAIQELAFSPEGSKLASVGMWADAVKIWPLEGLAD